MPNPFNATTSLRFHLASASPVHLSLYNLQGQRIRILADAPFNAGAHQVVWDGLNQRGHPAATGLYLARLITPTTPTHTKLLLIRWHKKTTS